MSYILEALKKSEQKRKRETVPGLQSVHESEDAKQKKSLWPWIILAVLCINAVLLLVLLPSWQKDKTLTVVETASEEQLPDQPLVPDTAVPSAPVPEIESASAFQSGPDSGENGNNKETGYQEAKILPDSALPPSTPAAEPPVVPALSQQVAVPSQPQSITEGQKEAEDEETEAADVTGETMEEAAFMAEPLENLLEEDQLGALNTIEKLDEDTDKKIPLLSKLPRSIQSELPELAISFHVYAKKPKSRLVSINGRVLREGQSVTSGLTVEEITSEGIVLNFKGDLFRMEVF